MRFKFGGDGPDIYRCCFCCHVRVGTIFLGVFVLFFILMLLSMFAVVVLHPELLEHNGHLFQSSNSGILATASHDNISLEAERWLSTHAQTGEDKFLGLLFLLGAFAITVMLLYGAVKGQAGYLMPFFCLQVFVFCLSCLTVVGYFSYFPNFRKWISQQDWMPFQDELKELDQDWLMLLVVMWFVLVLTGQAYLIGVVWACYKYINSCQLSSSTTTATGRTLVRDYGADPTSCAEDTEMLLPPKYEDVIRMNDEANHAQPPPPAYTED